MFTSFNAKQGHTLLHGTYNTINTNLIKTTTLAYDTQVDIFNFNSIESFGCIIIYYPRIMLICSLFSTCKSNVLFLKCTYIIIISMFYIMHFYVILYTSAFELTINI